MGKGKEVTFERGNIKYTLEGVVRVTKAEWMAKGEKLFGCDIFKWRFRCPNCGHIQTAEDFRQYGKQGATPETAYYSCIGRFMPDAKGNIGNTESPCDYTLGGLFPFVKTIVVDGESQTPVFEFATTDRG